VRTSIRVPDGPTPNRYDGMMARPEALADLRSMQPSGPGVRFVAVIDDDESVRESLPDLLRQFGHEVRVFASAEAFLSSHDAGRANCLILDIALPGMSGPELHRELGRQGRALPVIFITGQTDPSLRPRMLEHGAVACLFKPFCERALLDALDGAIGGAEP
jgi:FixJ family two-component response regulator